MSGGTEINMKKVTSVTVWNDSAGVRISITYSVVDPVTRKVKADNIRENYVLSDPTEVETATALTALAQTILSAGDEE